MYKAPVHKVIVSNYTIPKITQFSGKKYHNEFGKPIPIEYWKFRPNFSIISIPIINFLRNNFMNNKIGMRVLGSMEHSDKSIDNLIKIIQQNGHDRYDTNRNDNLYANTDLHRTELFMLEIKIGLREGINGEEQIEHALNSKYVYLNNPVRVDVVILYDLTKFEKCKIKYAGKWEVGHVFKYPEKKNEAVLSILKII